METVLGQIDQLTILKYSLIYKARERGQSERSDISPAEVETHMIRKSGSALVKKEFCRYGKNQRTESGNHLEA